MPTVQQIDAGFLLLLRETSDDTRFTPEQRYGFLNEAKNYIAALSNQTTDLVTVVTTQNVGAYTLPSDTLLINNAYFGTELTANGVWPLKVVTRKVLKELFPNWLDETAGAAGTPIYLVKFDQNTIYVHPRPDASQAGKKIFMDYGYVPADISASTDTPDIPVIYHSIMKFYAAYLAYLPTNQELATKLYDGFLKHYNVLKENVDREAEDLLRWKWVTDQ